jgi:hypothetical protein
MLTLVSTVVLKVVALEPSGFTEKRNLRVVGKPSLNFSTNDIRWHPRKGFSVTLLSVFGGILRVSGVLGVLGNRLGLFIGHRSDKWSGGDLELGARWIQTRPR